MNLNEVIQKFEQETSGKFSAADAKLIALVADELGLVDFEIKMKADGPEYFYDTANCLHVHRTMLVSSKSFTGSTDRGLKPYKNWPHHIELSQWIGRGGPVREKSGVRQFLCDGVWVPIGRECTCGKFHDDGD